MADLKLDILVVPTYNTYTLGIADASIYPNNPPAVSAPTIEITVPGFDVVSLPFLVNDFNIFNSLSLGLTTFGQSLLPLPDGEGLGEPDGRDLLSADRNTPLVSNCRKRRVEQAGWSSQAILFLRETRPRAGLSEMLSF